MSPFQFMSWPSIYRCKIEKLYKFILGGTFFKDLIAIVLTTLER